MFFKKHSDRVLIKLYIKEWDNNLKKSSALINYEH